MPTEEVLAEMRAPTRRCITWVGTQKGRLTRLEKHLIFDFEIRPDSNFL